MKIIVFLMPLFLFFNCAKQVKKNVILDIPLKEAFLKCHILNSRLGYYPKLKKMGKFYLLKSSFCELRIKKVDKKIEVEILSKSTAHNQQVQAFLEQTKTKILMEYRNGAAKKNRLGLVGLHIISPSFSYLYVEANNPFFGNVSPVAKFFLHLGIDGLIALTTGTDFFSDDFKFRPTTAAALFVHRALSLPKFMINMDYYNRSIQAGYTFKF